MTRALRICGILALSLGMGWIAFADPPRPAHADAKCAATCNTTHDACLISSNDRYKCDSERNQCLRSCSGS